MKISLRGVRGSLPTTDTDCSFYGGNTSCVVVTEGDSLLVLDGGSGIHKLKFDSAKHGKRIDVLLTHLHLDHILGLGFFNPFFDPSLHVHIWGPASNVNLHKRLTRYLSPPLFPVHLRDLPCELSFHEIENSSFEIGPFIIESRYVVHPGPTVGYRVSNGKSSFTYIPDHEPALGSSYEISENKKWISGFELALNTDLLLHDAQYSAEQYKTKAGWGHSSMDAALKFASLTNTKHLLLAHHDPLHTDRILTELFRELKNRNNTDFYYELASEGMEIELS